MPASYTFVFHSSRVDVDLRLSTCRRQWVRHSLLELYEVCEDTREETRYSVSSFHVEQSLSPSRPTRAATILLGVIDMILTMVSESTVP